MEKNPSLGTYSYNEYATGAKRYGSNAGLAPTTGPVDKTGYRERDAAIAARKNNMQDMMMPQGRPGQMRPGGPGGFMPPMTKPAIRPPMPGRPGIMPTPVYGKPPIQNKPIYGKGPIGGTTPGGRPSRPNQMTQGMGQSQIAQPGNMDNMPMRPQTKPLMNGQDPMMQAQIYKNWLRDNLGGNQNTAATNRMGRY